MTELLLTKHVLGSESWLGAPSFDIQGGQIHNKHHPLIRQCTALDQSFSRVSTHSHPCCPDRLTHRKSRRRNCVFYADNGGFQSSNRHDEDSDLLYFIGVIDIFTPYNFVKRTEHLWKSITQDKVSRNIQKTLGSQIVCFVEYDLFCTTKVLWSTVFALCGKGNSGLSTCLALTLFTVSLHISSSFVHSPHSSTSVRNNKIYSIH